MNETLKTIAKRRSIRQFGPEQISDIDLHTILEAGLEAPSGHNDQSWYFAVVQYPKLIKELSDGSKLEMQNQPIEWIAEIGKNEKLNIYYNAPTIIIVATRKDAATPIADASAAIQNMMLAATSISIASCWIGFAKFFFISPERNQKIGIPEDYEVQYGIALGNMPENIKSNPPVRKYEKYYHIIK